MELNNYKNDSIYPMFYYNSNLFPGSTLSLHLFEPRYRLMMQRIVNSTKKFVYAPNFTNYRADVGDVVLIANLKSCEFLHDGRALLSAEIGKRHEVIEHWVEDGTQNLHYCRLSKYEDEVLSLSDIAIADPIVTMLNAITNSYFTPQILRRIEEQCGPKPASNDYEVSSPCFNHSLTSYLLTHVRPSLCGIQASYRSEKMRNICCSSQRVACLGLVFWLIFTQKYFKTIQILRAWPIRKRTSQSLKRTCRSNRFSV